MAVSPGGRPADDSSFGSGDNWVTRAGGLPKYVREVAHALVRSGMPESRAIATAISRLKVWAAGGDHVRPQVQAAAAKAIAEWEAKKGSHVNLSNVHPKGVHADLKQHYPPHVLKWVKGAKWDKRTVPLGVIAMKSRPGKPHDAAKVDGMRKAIRAGKKFKPVVLVDTGKGPMQIADGYHRTRAHKLEGHSLIRAVVATNTASHGPWVKQMHDEKLNT